MIDLQQVQIARPCPADWNSMTGDAQTRFCASCKKAVHDLSQMTAAQAQELLDRTDGSVCVRITRTGDGRIVTRDAEFVSKKGRKARGPAPKPKPRVPPPVTVTGGAPLPVMPMHTVITGDVAVPSPTHTMGKPATPRK